MSDKQKLATIQAMIEQWSEQPDPEDGEGDSPEAADVLFAILKIAEST